jgi:hypothetical protein
VLVYEYELTGEESISDGCQATVRLRLFRLGYGVPVCSRERVWVSWMSTAPI